MSTIAFDLFQNFDARWTEVDLLLNMAKETEDINPKYRVLCRASIVLIVANLEGFLNEVLKCIIKDINMNDFFKHTSYRMKETFCGQFIDISDKGMSKKIHRLIETFDELHTQYTIEPFIYENGKNPKASVIDKLFYEVGGKNFFGYITDCDIEKAFENDTDYNQNLINSMKEVLVNGTESFPYDIKLEQVPFNLENNSVNKECLWNTFVNETLKARHTVAHGVSLEDTMTMEEILKTIEKVKIIELTFGLLICKKCISTQR